MRAVRRVRTGDSAYAVHDKTTGDLLGHVALEGVRGRDDYPWGWYLADGVGSSHPRGRATGATESLGDGVEQVAEWAAPKVGAQ